MIGRYSPRKRLPRRRGGILILAVVCLTAMFAFAALAVDIGYLMKARSESHRAADAAALAACWDYSKALADGKTHEEAAAAAIAKAQEYASGNPVASISPSIAAAGSDSDITIGYLDDLFDRSAPLSLTNTSANNAIEVRIRRTSAMNGAVPVFFAKVFGIDSQDVVSSATAAVQRNIGGLQAPSDGSNCDLLPFALDEDTWNALMDGAVTDDDWAWDEDAKCVTEGSDGIFEVNLFPQGTGSPGNRGTVDIGPANNSTSDIARQILEGVSAADLAHVGGKLEFNSDGCFTLNGDTGISAGVKDELAAIKGQPRVIPIFSKVEGPGNNAVYTIVKLVGVRIVDVHLTGAMNKKRVIIQPAPIVCKGVLPSSLPNTSDFVYSRVVLVR